MGKRGFYAEFKAYGLKGRDSVDDRCMRFDTAHERDAKVIEINGINPEYREGCARAAQQRELAHKYDTHRFTNDPWNTYVSEALDYTCDHKPYFELRPRPGYKGV